MTTHLIPEASPQSLVMAQIADEYKPMPSDEDVKRIAREHQLADTEAEALVRFARAVTKIAESEERPERWGLIWPLHNGVTCDQRGAFSV